MRVTGPADGAAVVCMNGGRRAEPVHRAGVSDRIPELVAAPGLVVASSAHVYPDIVHAQAIAGVAERVVEELHPRLEAVQREEVAA